MSGIQELALIKALLEELYNKFQPYITDENPFGKRVPVNNDVTWLRPYFIANIRYSELTREGIMRHPVFQGLREDKTIEDMKKSNTSVKDTTDKQVLLYKDKSAQQEQPYQNKS